MRKKQPRKRENKVYQKDAALECLKTEKEEGKKKTKEERGREEVHKQNCHEKNLTVNE